MDEVVAEPQREQAQVSLSLGVLPLI